LPPGRARLATSPAPTGSPLNADGLARRSNNHIDLAADEFGGREIMWPETIAPLGLLGKRREASAI
jgi:hypothetical protein